MSRCRIFVLNAFVALSLSVPCALGGASSGSGMRGPGGGHAAPAGRIAINEAAAVAACKTYAMAQDIYRRTDWDKDGVLEYAQAIRGNFSLFETKKATGDIALVDAAFAAASEDAAAPPPLKDSELPQPDEGTKKALAKLTKKLASEEYAERAAASKALAKLGPKAIRPLETLAGKSTDPEVAARCHKAAAKLRKELRFSPDRFKTGKASRPTPKSGYCYRVLKGQGPGAPRAAKRSYLVGGNMTLGYALLAYPAEYGKTGRHCFIINTTGTVYKRDLGPDTAKRIKTICAYDPAGWVLAE